MPFESERNFAICRSEIDAGSGKTTHVTVGLHFGVVSDPTTNQIREEKKKCLKLDFFYFFSKFSLPL
jgi:hypothetical protein